MGYPKHPETQEQADAAARKLVEIQRKKYCIPDFMTYSQPDEELMLNNMSKCYGDKVLKLGISVEHYRYLVENIVSMRQYIQRNKTESKAGSPDA